MKQIYFAKILVLSCLFSFLKPEKLFAQCTLFITQNPAGQTCSSPALIANYSGIVNPPVPGNKYFICDSHPWNSLIYDTALNNVFGIGNWSLVDYVNANAATIFSAATQFVYIEGSDGNEAEQTAYLAANQAVIEAWVAAGGRLLLNRAPNAGAAITSFGFGGVNNHYTNPQGNVTVTPAHPIGSGPYLPAGYGPYYGASF